MNRIAFLLYDSRDELFDALWKEYYPKVAVFLRVSFGMTDTDDAVQDIMLKIFSNIDSYDPRWAPSTWIYSIARNHAVDLLKKTVPAQVPGDALHKIPSGPAYDPENLLMAVELSRGIESFLGALPQDKREISYLRFYQKLKYREIASITGIPAGTVKYTVHRIKKDFEAFYGENYEN